MTTIGDILLILLIVTVSSLSLWGTMVATSLLFPYKAARLAQVVEKRPWASIVTGFFVTAPVLIVLIVLANFPNPVVKLLAFAGLLTFLAIAAVGASGQVRLLADRIKATSGDLPMFTSLGRAAAVIVLVFNIPLLGTFLMAPLSLMAGTGSLVLSAIGRKAQPETEASRL